MIALVVRRLGVLVLTLLVTAALSFALLHAAPGGPFDRERSVPPEVEAALARHYGLDRPVLLDLEALGRGELGRAFADTQLGRWLGGLLRGELGPSLQHRGLAVEQLLAAGLPVSAAVGLLGLEVALVLGLGGGLLAAARHGRMADRLVRAAASAALAVPPFLLAVALALIFGLGLGWLPVAGWGQPRHLVLPALALGIPYGAVIARLVRSAVLEVLAEPFVRTARAKGLGGTAVLLRHALRPALVPVVQYLGPLAAGLVTGSVAVETVFNLPGVGIHFVAGALNRDYPLVMGTVLLYAGSLLVLNALADLVALWLDPRGRQHG
ncbi:MAG: ABC transporter [Planctomycetota bacterium]|nr:MAG: ABC transporter [Planctomycetota bacterium]